MGSDRAGACLAAHGRAARIYRRNTGTFRVRPRGRLQGPPCRSPPRRSWAPRPTPGFCCSAMAAATAIAFRFLTGIALAGIYPLGMKLVVSWAPDRAGLALGWLVGALTAGTAIPFLARAVGGDIYWQEAVLASSVLALVGAGLVSMVGEGPAVKGRSGLRLGPGVARVPRAGVPGLRPRLLRAHVGAVRLLGAGAGAGRVCSADTGPRHVADDVRCHRGGRCSAAWLAVG